VTSRLTQPLGRLAASAILTPGVLGLAVFASSAPAAAAPPTPMCSGGTCTVTFSTAGTGQSWVVPAGVTSESLTLYGAIGGSGEDTVGSATFLGGDGAKVTGTLSAGPGSTLTVDVGGAGSNLGRTGGINGGGTGGDELTGGGGGGTDVQRAGVDQLVAGGGGGAGQGGENFCGGDGPNDPSAGTGGNAGAGGMNGGLTVVGTSPASVTFLGGFAGVAGESSGLGGLGGTATAAVDPCIPPGTTFAGAAGGDGTSGQGGSSVSGGGGGGGGGGLFGGGQGGDGAFDNHVAAVFAGSGGGGGGSSDGVSSDLVVSPTGNPSDGSFNGGNGEVVISYADPTATTTTTVATTTTTIAHVAASTSSSTAPALAVTGVDVVALLIAGSTLIGVGTLILAGTATSRRKRTRTP
jgi:hypothetical protein